MPFATRREGLSTSRPTSVRMAWTSDARAGVRRKGSRDLILLQLISGAVGGNLAGSLKKEISLGTLGNSISGILGGGLGGQLLGMLGVGTSTGGVDIASIIGSIAGGGVGGGILMAVVGLIKQAMAKK